MNTLWAFGDSFTKGLGLVDDGHQYPPYKGKENLIWPQLLADHLGNNLQVIAFNGISNDMIWDNVIDKFDDITEGDTVVIGLTKCARFGVYSPGHKQTGLFNKAPIRDSQLIGGDFAKWGLKNIRDNVMDVFKRNDTNFTFLCNQFEAKGVKAYYWNELLWSKFSTISQETRHGDDHWGIRGHQQMFNHLKKEMKL